MFPGTVSQYGISSRRRRYRRGSRQPDRHREGGFLDGAWRRPQRHSAAACSSDPGLPTPFGGEVPDFDPKQYVRPRKSLKVMSRDIQLAFAAADMACDDAGLRESPLDPERLGVVLGADMMPCDLDELVGHVSELHGRGAVRLSAAGARRFPPNCFRSGCSNICPTCRPATSASPRTPAARTTPSPWARSPPSRPSAKRPACWVGARPTR